MSLRRRRVAHAGFDASGEPAVKHDEICSFPTAGGECLPDLYEGEPPPAPFAASTKKGKKQEKADATE